MALMAKYNIFFLPGKMGCFSEAHSAGDLKRLIYATESIVASDL
jgi:glutamate-1-semialdehyde 2,1-aminomutase